MRSGARGRATSVVEVTNVSGHGFWLFLDDRERFVSFAALCNVERPRPGHLYWPDLDVDSARADKRMQPARLSTSKSVAGRTARG